MRALDEHMFASIPESCYAKHHRSSAAIVITRTELSAHQHLTGKNLHLNRCPIDPSVHTIKFEK